MQTLLEKKEEKLIAGIEKDSLPFERETYISFDDETVSNGYVKIDSFQRLVIKQLLENEEFSLDNMHRNGNEVTYLSGTLPLNAIRIKDKATGKNELNYILKH
jgi:hypothetical protein